MCKRVILPFLVWLILSVLITACGGTASTEEVGSAPTGERETTQADELMSQLRNLTYQNEFADGEATLNDGEYRAPVAEGSASELVIQLVEAVVNENPSAPIVAAVILATDPGGSGSFYDLALVAKQNDELINTASTFLGDRVQVEQIALDNDVVTIEMKVHAEEDPLCCPTLPASKTFRLEGSNLVEDSASESEQQPSDELALAWKLDTQKDEQDTPLTQIALVVEGQEVEIGEGQNITEIEKSDWETYQIPPTALIACGGWWAGFGDYYYVVREEGKLQIMQGFAGEGMDPDELYQYEAIHEINVP